MIMRVSTLPKLTESFLPWILCVFVFDRKRDWIPKSLSYGFNYVYKVLDPIPSWILMLVSTRACTYFSRNSGDFFRTLYPSLVFGC